MGVIWGNRVSQQLQGIGMTSQRTRQRLVQRLSDQGVTNLQVLDVMGDTPRHIFLDEALSHRAYEDTALPIGYGQTLSQPYIVARMTEVLIGAAGKLDRVLEVGTGSGYQTSVLAQLVPKVYSVERIKPLQDKARDRLRKIGLRNVELKHADGGFGWPERGPFDAILSTAAPREVPPELLDQLGPNGVLVIPVGGDTQELRLIIREGDTDKFMTQVLEPVKFVPLLSGVTR
jgi:protein-L-isoaspartate(D-aspartate) O-methyltransferase